MTSQTKIIPERVIDPLLGGTDGKAMFESLIEALG
jgi:phosphoribosylformylglycinamidine synthase subunit PurQ / glutaminase